MPSECQNSLDTDQARHLSGLIWVQTVCKGYQQRTILSKELVISDDGCGVIELFLGNIFYSFTELCGTVLQTVYEVAQKTVAQWVTLVHPTAPQIVTFFSAVAHIA